ncbi:hypothetical protein D3C81_2023850 [compost metagenome]
MAKNKAVLGIKREDRLGPVPLHGRLIWIATCRRIWRAGRIVEGDRIVGNDEFNVRLFRGDDLTNPFTPDGQVQRQ